MKPNLKLLFLDIETAPNLATVWSIWNQNIAINQLLETSRVMCFAAKWYGEEDIIFSSEFDSSHEHMVNSLHDLLSEADAVIHYNGKRFDMPTINREFLKYGMLPPTPYKQVDLLNTVKKNFRFASNKLDHICDELGIGRKKETGGHELWLKCMDGDPEAWKVMKEYNIQDVALLEELYEKLLPWIGDHPNVALYYDSENPTCPNCGSEHVIKNGTVHTNVSSYQRYRCDDCGTNLRGRENLLNKVKSRNILTQVK